MSAAWGFDMLFPGAAPVHPHVYSNGDICLNLLGSDWRPSLSISSIAVAVLSMLTTAKQKQLPLDNASRKRVPTSFLVSVNGSGEA